MNMRRAFIFVILAAFAICCAAWAEEPDANAIVKKADDIANSFKDMSFDMKMVTRDAKGNESDTAMTLYQKGPDRLIQFTAPAKDRGVTFLTLGNDENYVYMPEFKKIRRIASHVKNQGFMGSDYAYEDMTYLRFGDRYNARMLDSAGTFYVMELTPKPGMDVSYSKLVISVHKENLTTNKIEYYGPGGEKQKVEERTGYQQIKGYWFAQGMKIVTLKENHTTDAHMSNPAFDSGLSDELFSQRYLKRPAK